MKIAKGLECLKNEAIQCSCISDSMEFSANYFADRIIKKQNIVTESLNKTARESKNPGYGLRSKTTWFNGIDLSDKESLISFFFSVIKNKGEK